MKSSFQGKAAWQTDRERVYRGELAERIARATPLDGRVEPLKGVTLHRASRETDPRHGVSKPAFCVIAQGSKQVLLGESVYRYDPAHYLLARVELPVVSRIIAATPDRPYLSLRLALDASLLSSVLVEARHSSARGRGEARAIDVSPLDADLLDVMLGERFDAATAGYRVGYEDASQFSREYKRLFGQPPTRDVEGLRKAAA